MASVLTAPVLRSTRASVQSLRVRIVAAPADRFYAAALVFWGAAWYLRLSLLMSWLPIEPLVIGSFAIAACVVHRIGQSFRFEGRTWGPTALLILSFLPGALETSGTGYGPTKVTSLIFVVLPAFVAALILLTSPASRSAWVALQVVGGAAVALAATLHPGTDAETGRFTLPTVDPISAGRLVGSAAVILVVWGLASARHAWWALPLAIADGAVLVRMGDRGPLLSGFVAVMFAVAVCRCFEGRRLLVGLVVAGAGRLAYVYAIDSGGYGGHRVAGWLQDGLADPARSGLLHDALVIGLHHPWGIGWGDFAQVSEAGAQIANAHGVAYAHNVLAEAFCEGGVLALSGLLLVMVLALVRLRNLSSTSAGAACSAITAYWLMNAMVSSDLVTNQFMWLSVACGMASLARGSTIGAADPACSGPEDSAEHRRHEHERVRV